MANGPELNITNVGTSEYRSGIPLQNWESVEAALKLYESGASRGRTARDHNIQAYGESYGGLGALLFMLGNSRGQETFVDGLLQEARPSVQNHGQWSRHYDYDGPGRFHKTSVEIKALGEQQDGYLLGLNAAYVGKEVEDNLAAALGIEQGLEWKSVGVRLSPEGINQFRIDFDQVVDRLQPVVADLSQPKGRERISGLDATNYFMSINEWRESARNYVLGTKDGIEVVLDLGRVGRRLEYNNGKVVVDNWKQEGAVLSGLLDRDYKDESKFVPPSFVVSMHRLSQSRYDRLPIIDPNMKSMVNGLAERVVAAFQPANQ